MHNAHYTVGVSEKILSPLCTWSSLYIPLMKNEVFSRAPNEKLRAYSDSIKGPTPNIRTILHFYL